MQQDPQTRRLTNHPWRILLAVLLVGMGGMVGLAGGGLIAICAIIACADQSGGGYYGELAVVPLYFIVVVLAAGAGALLGSWGGIVSADYVLGQLPPRRPPSSG